jgi:F-type H+-transporting ATPase subunit gamma
MASIKDLKKRIQSTKNTQQTTKAMKMVSAAYLRRAQDAINNQKPYAKRLGSLLQRFTSMDELPIHSPLLQTQVDEAPEGGKKLILVVVTSDRGLCGGFNANVIKTAQRWVRDHKREYDHVELAFVGRKGYDFLKSRKYSIGTYFQELGGKVTFAKARKLSDALTGAFLSGKATEVKIVYNEFQNAITQVPVVEHFLPLRPENKHRTSDDQSMVIVKPSAAEVLEQLLQKHFPIQAFRILLESQAGEHGARMSAMENATKNAGEMIGALTLEYNKQRQAGITKELLEIIAGSESQKVS